jgi:hypothetical protein
MAGFGCRRLRVDHPQHGGELDSALGPTPSPNPMRPSSADRSLREAHSRGESSCPLPIRGSKLVTRQGRYRYGDIEGEARHSLIRPWPPRHTAGKAFSASNVAHTNCARDSTLSHPRLVQPTTPVSRMLMVYLVTSPPGLIDHVVVFSDSLSTDCRWRATAAALDSPHCHQTSP